jgi:hypothetical protein
MASRSSSSTELAVRLGEDPDHALPGRGADLQLVLSYHWLDRQRRGELSPAEARLKQTVWEWFSRLSPAALERVRKVNARAPASAAGAQAGPGAARAARRGLRAAGAHARRARGPLPALHFVLFLRGHPESFSFVSRPSLTRPPSHRSHRRS